MSLAPTLAPGGSPGVLRLSVSAYQAFQRCEAKYYYRFFKGITKRVRDIAPQRGIILHEYMEGYYRQLKEGTEPGLAHKLSLAHVLKKFTEPCQTAVAFAVSIEDMELAQGYSELLPAVERIAKRYFYTRGRDDAERYEVVLIEERLVTQLIPGVISHSVIDLVLKERNTGLHWLTEHKSTQTPPDASVRLRDFQTLLYATMLERKRRVKIDGVLWNYIRTKEPTVPRLLKTPLKGTKDVFPLTRDKAIDTTWEVYHAEILKHGLDPAGYLDMLELLRDREFTTFFPRFEQIISASPAIMLRDYVVTSARMRAAVAQWAAGVEPVRTNARDCTWCDYARLCEAFWTGGDTEELIDLYYDVKGRTAENGSSVAAVASDPEDDLASQWGEDVTGAL